MTWTTGVVAFFAALALAWGVVSTLRQGSLGWAQLAAGLLGVGGVIYTWNGQPSWQGPLNGLTTLLAGLAWMVLLLGGALLGRRLAASD